MINSNIVIVCEVFVTNEIINYPFGVDGNEELGGIGNTGASIS